MRPPAFDYSLEELRVVYLALIEGMETYPELEDSLLLRDLRQCLHEAALGDGVPTDDAAAFERWLRGGAEAPLF